MKKIIIITLTIIFGLASPVFAGKKVISISSFKSKWPFSVDEGV